MMNEKLSVYQLMLNIENLKPELCEIFKLSGIHNLDSYSKDDLTMFIIAKPSLLEQFKNESIVDFVNKCFTIEKPEEVKQSNPTPQTEDVPNTQKDRVRKFNSHNVKITGQIWDVLMVECHNCLLDGGTTVNKALKINAHNVSGVVNIKRDCEVIINAHNDNLKINYI